MSKREKVVESVASGIKERGKELESKSNIPDIPLRSFPELNKKLWGLHKQKLYIVGARTSQGKTAFALQMILDALSSGKSVVYLSFEMSKGEIIDRSFCNMYNVNNYDLITGKFNKHKETYYGSFQKQMDNKKFVFSSGMGWNWDDVEKFFKEEAEAHPDIIVVDYIQAISQGSKEGKGFIDEYILKFREYCIKYDVCGILVSQLNRTATDSKDKQPQLQHLKGSGYLEELADVAILLEWVNRNRGTGHANLYTINVAKNRSGLTGYVNMHFIPEFYKFVEIPDKEQTINYDPRNLQWTT